MLVNSFVLLKWFKWSSDGTVSLQGWIIYFFFFLFLCLFVFSAASRRLSKGFYLKMQVVGTAQVICRLFDLQSFDLTTSTVSAVIGLDSRLIYASPEYQCGKIYLWWSLLIFCCLLSSGILFQQCIFLVLTSSMQLCAVIFDHLSSQLFIVCYKMLNWTLVISFPSSFIHWRLVVNFPNFFIFGCYSLYWHIPFYIAECF